MPRPYRLALPALLALALAACDKADEPAATASPAAAAATPVVAPNGDDGASAALDHLLGRANAALAADRLFEPAGDNALELYLQALEAAARSDSAGAPRARRLSDAMATGDRQAQIQLAISDIFPYGLVWVEQAAAGGEREDAERVFALLQRAQPQSNALRRLRGVLDQPVALASAAEPAVAAPRALAAEAASVPPAGALAAQPVSPATEASLASTQPARDVPPPGAASAPAASAPPAVTAADVAAAPVGPAALPAAAPAAPRAAMARPVTLPIAISQPAPRYPPRALKQRIEGWVLVGFTIRTDGSVDQVQVLDAQPEGLFDREAVGSMQRWRFQPPAEAIVAQRRIEFSLGAR